MSSELPQIARLVCTPALFLVANVLKGNLVRLVTEYITVHACEFASTGISSNLYRVLRYIYLLYIELIGSASI